MYYLGLCTCTFARRRNRLMTHFSERILVVKRRISVLTNKMNFSVIIYFVPIISTILTQKIISIVVVCVFVLRFVTLDAGLLAISLYSEGPATGHLDTGFFSVSLCL